MFSKIKNFINNHRSLSIGIISFFLLIASIGASIIYFQTDKVSAEAHENFLKLVDTYNFENKFDQAEAAINSHLKKRLSPEQRWDTSNVMGQTLENQEKYQEALEWYKKADEINAKSDYKLAESIGRLSLQQGDTSTAITYYKKAIDLARADANPFAQWYIDGFKAIIEKLEKGEPVEGGAPLKPGEILENGR